MKNSISYHRNQAGELEFGECNQIQFDSIYNFRKYKHPTI